MCRHEPSKYDIERGKRIEAGLPADPCDAVLLGLTTTLLRLHYYTDPFEFVGGPVCAQCDPCGCEPWPCPTYLALEACVPADVFEAAAVASVLDQGGESLGA